MKVKVKFTLEQATKPQRKSKGIAVFLVMNVNDELIIHGHISCK
jgi:hypothetical protein